MTRDALNWFDMPVEGAACAFYEVLLRSPVRHEEIGAQGPAASSGGIDIGKVAPTADVEGRRVGLPHAAQA